ncbi:MAG: glycosyltransferase [Phycisphaerae bacterium]|jgi:glycogen(starch) synthase|nr:glycosyltransferase [Phycisphaerae bacterium]
MKVLMLGWEFPPFISGGLGTACYGLTKAMSQVGAEVIFVLPRPVASQYTSHVKLVSPTLLSAAAGSYSYQVEEFANVTFRAVNAGGGYSAYESARTASPAIEEQIRTGRHASKLRQTATQGKAPSQTVVEPQAHYGGDLFSEVERYARMATLIATEEDFDVVHAHDWMTFRAGIAISAMSGRPLVVQVHSTEFDRTGEHVDQRIYDIEREGMHYAKRIIAVSHLTKRIIVARYGIPEEKVEVVYNAVDFNGHDNGTPLPPIGRNDKIVLFLGRITMQKGPEYFLAAAKKVLEVMQNVRFIMAGWGDMIRRTIQLANEMGIGHKVLFTGFLRGPDVDRVFRMADLYVMPSVSEPFGIAPLEAMNNDVPVLISKQSGVSEVLSHALKVDFWDVNEMANKIVAVLRHPPLQKTLREHGRIEVRKLSWADSARRCLEVYQQAGASRN